jgi:signal recognition particle GTPase
MMEELSEHLIEYEVKGSLIHKIIDDLRVARTQHSTSDSEERLQVEKELKKQPQLIRRLVQIFYYDYALFGFKFPTI